ncbi:hypothetical protein [Mycobacteroides abscessus]|uniref:hypothetical protein n=1 Tax=Mycobacteroides abscessus TaxID=36809 RepID=UPI000C261F5C|nr:hypothetical protein [Mycobacteroides abscessus]RIR12831.1 hypothetical protein D2E27_16175 [Mycobacteroides abscessus]RIR65835.1 hypothetical protein D2E62_14460 [Mycobacteroides abscessus]RIS08578.1 hypothetical protein D2E58_01590 [Mycobacteroides abscessus]
MSIDYGYPAHWAPRPAREQREQQHTAAMADLERMNSGCPGSSRHSASDAYPSDWTPKKGEVKE